MITIEYLDMPLAYWWPNVGMITDSFIYGGIGENLIVPGFLIQREDQDPADVSEFNLGRLTQDHVKWGKLRDKGVKHLNCSGDLHVATTSVQVGTENGHPYAVGSSNGTHYGYVDWLRFGEDRSYEQTWYPANVTYSGYVYSKPGGTKLTTAIVWNAEKTKMINLLTWHHQPVYRNGTLYRSETITSRIVKYRVSGTPRVLYYMNQQTGITGYPTATQQAAAFASIGTSGGSVFNYQNMQQGSSITQELAYSYITAAVEAEYRSLDLFSQEDDPFTDFGELALECSSQLDYVDQNILGMMFDVTEWRSFLGLWKTLTHIAPWKRAADAVKRLSLRKKRPLRSTHEAVRTMHDMLDPASSVYLGTLYGVLPSVSDIRRLQDGIVKFMTVPLSQRLHSRKVSPIEYPDALTGEREAVFTVETSRLPTSSDFSHLRPLEDWQAAIAGMKRWGLYPEVGNLYDRIPYSFCLDWIIPVGDTLDAVNNYMDQEWYFPIQYCISSLKYTKGKSINSMVPASMLATGTVEFSYYVRTISRELPLPTVPLPKVESRLGLHSAESAALLFQRFRP